MYVVVCERFKKRMYVYLYVYFFSSVCKYTAYVYSCVCTF